MSVFLPIVFAPTAAPLLSQQKNQMSPLAARPGNGFSLGELSAIIYQQLGTAAVLGDHAIPSIGAYVEYMADTVLTTQPSGPNPHYQSAWHGVLAMVALSKLYNFNIRVEARSLPGDNAITAKTPLNAVYKREMRRLGLLDQGERYYVVFRDEYPLAVLHPNILLCPFKNIDSRAVQNVPWISWDDDGKWHWEEIAPCAAPGMPEPAGNPTQTEKFMLCAWLLEQADIARAQGNAATADVLDGWKTRLANGQDILPLANYTARPLPGFAALNGMKFGALDLTAFSTVPDFKIPINVQQLTDKLLFTNENISTLAGANGWDLRINAGAPGGNPVVPPITADFAQMLAEERKSADIAGTRPTLELTDVRVLYDKFAASGEVTVQITVRNDMLQMVQTKTYKGENIIYVNNFPYVCMWPYTYLSPKEWKDYYVDMVPVLNPAPKPTGLCQEIDASTGNLNFAVPGDMVHDLKSRDNHGFTYRVLQSDQFPWFVPLAYTDALGQQHQGGCLLARPTGNMILPSKKEEKALAAIDFGTSNSVCAVKCGVETFYNVLDGSMVRTLAGVKANSAGAAVVENFHRYYGFSNSTKDGKFASVAELYSTGNNQPFIDGQILLTESGIIDYFTAQNTNLQAIGIYSNLKRDTTSVSDSVTQAIEIFVTQLTQLCALVAKQNGCSTIEYCFSYPNEAYCAVLQDVWNTAIGEITRRNIFITVESSCITEYNASAQYVQNFGGLLAMAIPKAGFAVVDIGGGTSDMTVWQNQSNDINAPAQKLGSLSFQYAGNQIFSHSFFTYFKKNPAQLNTVLPQIFGFKSLSAPALPPTAGPDEKAKALRDAKARKAIQNYIDAIGEVKSVDDEAKFPALTALLNTLLEEPGIDKVFWNSTSCSDLRMMVSFKLKGILFVLANLIWEYYGIDTEAGTYRIFLVGGGSLAFGLPEAANATIFQQSAKQLLTKLTDIDPDANSNPFDIIQPQSAKSKTNAKPKTEVVNGTLVCMEKNGLRHLLRPTTDAPGDPGNAVGQQTGEDSQSLLKNLEKMYRVFVIYAVQQDPSLRSLLPKLELPSGDAAPTPAQQAVSTSFTGGALNVWSQVDKNLDKNISVQTRLSAFAVRMAEELLNQ